MIDIPQPYFVAAAAALFGLAVLIARSMFDTVRRAALVVNANEALRATVAAQKDCIDALEDKVNNLMTTVKLQAARILQLERIVGDDAERSRLRAERHEAREVRQEAREVKQEARAEATE